MIASAPMRSAEMDSVLRVLAPLFPRRGARWRVAVLCGLLVSGTVFFGWFVDQFYPRQEWLFFYYARAWLYAALFLVASLAGGLRILGWLVPESLRLGERIVLGLAAGVLTFFWGMFLAGLFGLYGPVWFHTWPAALLLLGGPKVVRIASRAWVHLRRFGVRLILPRTSVELLGALLVVLSSAAIYLQVMVPGNIGADSNSYHLPIAEHFAAAGGIRPFADGWYGGAYPHLASILYAWAMLAPGSYPDRLALCSHLEWALFLATLAGVAVLAGRLTKRQRLPFAGAVVFLFPGIFLYDSSLTTGADHVLAFWAPALALALLRLGHAASMRNALLVGVLTGAPLLTKYNAAYLLAPTALIVLVLTLRAWRLGLLLAWGLGGLAITSAFWLKNWFFYGDPLYPLLYAYLPSHPFHEGAAELMATTFSAPQFQLTGTPGEKLEKTLRALVTFSFEPNDWPSFHGNKPVFGSLFTLLVPALFLLRPPRRLWMLVLGVHIGLVVWYVTNHQDRYLQALMPWMAACTAATLALAWRHGPFVRGAAAVLVALQWVWGSDVYFFRTHAMLGDSSIRAAGEFLGAAHQKRYHERFDRPGSLQEVGDHLPPGTTLLVHYVDEKLGARAQTVLDAPGRQGAFEYLLLDSPHAVHARWREMGITHVVWIPTWGMDGDDLPREAVFARTIHQLTGTFQDRSQWRVATLSATPKDERQMPEPTKIGWLECRSAAPLGIYTPRGVTLRIPEAPLSEATLATNPLSALAGANALVLDRNCGGLAPPPSALASQFVLVTHPGHHEVWVRERARHGG